MQIRVQLAFVILIVLALYMTTYIRIPQQKDYPVASYVNSVKENRRHKNATKLFHGKKVATAVKTLRMIHKECQKVSPTPTSYWNGSKPTGLVWYTKNLNVYYCIVPKVGCTYWKRIMKFISQDFPQDKGIQTPTDIDRKFVHAGKHPHIQEFKISNKKMWRNMTKRAFMFVRNPYTRLWSAYLDKMFLPDFFQLMNKFTMFARPNMTTEELECDSILSFQEFLTAITKMRPKIFNRHWEPIHSLCSPCQVKYAAIGKLENFAEDTQYILATFGMNWNNTTSKRTQVYEEIKTLTKYNFEIVLPKMKCFKEMDLAERLWKTFQYNGYIDRYTLFPVAEFTSMNSTSLAIQTFMEVVNRTLNLQTKDITSQKRTMMLEAYRAIPEELIDTIKKTFKYDFELFGYEKDVFK